ncbi:hypothetical protein PTSG_04348 [Salpingoeca rosetta]|uniref:histidinol-phosphate transaminase n=1 Tax=Salpingoeca rosetta (strain ATCC 50818 / BSB-021) TaxID=946362 RepID=F2U8A5_SALR5|nr:uncharacterized protein PTSG_04348 [Salpingoeca rosetta]EGD72613.1 hypothetical protein PTSG_04348 [Salpingoeca rosetta]|eukprot:XP_004994436.1 hypothetical protein PTSG_04348 [Salpingoeca rosetta]
MSSNNVSDITRFVAPHLAKATYKGVETVEAIAKEVGLPVEKLVKLNANENVYGAPQQVLDAITKVQHHVYPDPSQVKLRKAVAGLMGVTPENVCCGAGSDDLLDIIIRMVNPKAIVTSTPTFGMYSFLGSVANVDVINVPRNDDFTVDVDAVRQAIRDNGAKIAFLASPNNPTGTLLPNADVETLAQEDCLIIVDEAYADFCDETAMSLFGKHDNLIICRTMSKWAGLAGLRLGFAVAHKDLVSVMMAIKQPYNVNTAAEAAGLAAIEHREAIMVTVRAMRQERDRLFNELKQFSWLRPIPSSANFTLIEVTGDRSAHDVYMALRKRGIIIRFFGSQGGNLNNFIRISAGKPEHTDAVLAALKAIEQDA